MFIRMCMSVIVCYISAIESVLSICGTSYSSICIYTGVFWVYEVKETSEVNNEILKAH